MRRIATLLLFALTPCLASCAGTIAALGKALKGYDVEVSGSVIRDNTEVKGTIKISKRKDLK